MNARVSHLWGLKRCVNGNRSTLHELGVKGNPPRKLVPVKGLGTASHKDRKAASEMEDICHLQFMMISLGCKSQFSPNSQWVTLSQMQLGYKSWVTSKQESKKIRS